MQPLRACRPGLPRGAARPLKTGWACWPRRPRRPLRSRDTTIKDAPLFEFRKHIALLDRTSGVRIELPFHLTLALGRKIRNPTDLTHESVVGGLNNPDPMSLLRVELLCGDQPAGGEHGGGGEIV